jgi:hypothetical protein
LVFEELSLIISLEVCLGVRDIEVRGHESSAGGLLKLLEVMVAYVI